MHFTPMSWCVTSRQHMGYDAKAPITTQAQDARVEELTNRTTAGQQEKPKRRRDT